MRRYHSELTLMLHRWVLRRATLQPWRYELSPPRPVPLDLQLTYQVLEILRDGDVKAIDSPGIYRKRRPLGSCCARHRSRERGEPSSREQRDRAWRREDKRQRS